MQRDALTAWLDTYLDIAAYDDPSLNGLQVEGAKEITKVALAVDASLSAIEGAAGAGADMLIVHHGLFWGPAKPIVGPHRARIAALLEHDINLYAAHIPLDAHREVGNNWGLARLLGLDDLQDFGTWRGRPVGVKGVFPTPTSLRDIADTLERQLGESVLVHAGGPLEIASLGIISGGAAESVVEAAAEGLDAFLTGEPKHDTFHDAFELKINAMFAGHYMTETVGVNRLAVKLQEEFDLITEFLMLPTGL
ncbi:Nif3-like dinuclear metal center hexameric protein [soil metagenome]|nr:Nif3-like dinuclear metal center hexameric protein [Trueperaceae bacterium]